MIKILLPWKKGDSVWILGDMGSPYAFGKIAGLAQHGRWFVRYHFQGPKGPMKTKSQIRPEKIARRKKGGRLELVTVPPPPPPPQKGFGLM